MTITEKITALRTEKKIKSSEVAYALEMTQSNYARLEKRDKDLSINQLESIAVALGVTVDDILHYGEEKQQIVDNEKVKELENKVLLLEKDLEISNMKLDKVDEIKHRLYEKIFFHIVLNIYVSHILKDFFLMSHEKLQVHFSKSYDKNFFIKVSTKFCNHFFFQEVKPKELKELQRFMYSPEDVIKYADTFYKTHKVLLDIDIILSKIENKAITMDIDIFEEERIQSNEKYINQFKVIETVKEDDIFFYLSNKRNSLFETAK